MKITCEKSALVIALNRASTVAASKTTMPILSSVLLRKVGNGQLQIAATDTEIGYTTHIPAKFDGDEPVAVHARDLLDRVKAMPDGELKLDATARAVVITAKGSKRRFERAAQPGDLFPSLPQMAEGIGFGIEARLLLTMLEAVHFAIDLDPSRAIGNLLLRWSPGKVMAVAVNNHRMSTDERTIDGVTGSGQTLLPMRAVGELRNLLDQDERLTVVLTERTTFFDFGEFELSARKPAEDSFPPFESFPAKRLPNPVRLPVAPALEAIAAVNLSAGRGDHTVNLTLQFSGAELMMTAESADRGLARDVVPCEWDGPDFSLCANGSYLAQALVACGSESVALSIDAGDDLAPLHVAPWDEQAGRVHYGVVMPTRK